MRPTAPRVRPRKRCQYCGQPFVSRVKATRFCSRDCARLFRLARLL